MGGGKWHHEAMMDGREEPDPDGGRDGPSPKGNERGCARSSNGQAPYARDETRGWAGEGAGERTPQPGTAPGSRAHQQARGQAGDKGFSPLNPPPRLAHCRPKGTSLICTSSGLDLAVPGPEGSEVGIQAAPSRRAACFSCAPRHGVQLPARRHPRPPEPWQGLPPPAPSGHLPTPTPLRMPNCHQLNHH